MLVSYQGYNKMEAWNAGVCSVKLLIDYSSYLHFVSQPGFYLVMENLYLPPFESIGFFSSSCRTVYWEVSHWGNRDWNITFVICVVSEILGKTKEIKHMHTKLSLSMRGQLNSIFYAENANKEMQFFITDDKWHEEELIISYLCLLIVFFFHPFSQKATSVFNVVSKTYFLYFLYVISRAEPHSEALSVPVGTSMVTRLI